MFNEGCALTILRDDGTFFVCFLCFGKLKSFVLFTWSKGCDI